MAVVAPTCEKPAAVAPIGCHAGAVVELHLAAGEAQSARGIRGAVPQSQATCEYQVLVGVDAQTVRRLVETAIEDVPEVLSVRPLAVRELDRKVRSRSLSHMFLPRVSGWFITKRPRVRLRNRARQSCRPMPSRVTPGADLRAGATGVMRCSGCETRIACGCVVSATSTPRPDDEVVADAHFAEGWPRRRTDDEIDADHHRPDAVAQIGPSKR